MNIANVIGLQAPEGYRKIKDADELLKGHKTLVTEIFKLVGIQVELFDKYYSPAIKSVAEFVQEVPASESHHHSYSGGLLEHILQTIIYALRARKSYILPAGAGPEDTTRLADLYTYCVFVGAIMHDIAKPVTDLETTLYTRKLTSIGKLSPIGKWNPFAGNMADKPAAKDVTIAKFYSVKYRTDRKYRYHEQASLMMSKQIIPALGLNWLLSEPGVFQEFLITSANLDEHSTVKEIVKKGDTTSVSLSLGSQSVPSFSNTKPLHQKIVTSIRKLKDDGTITFNRKGSNAWFKDGVCWVMGKTLADLVREQLRDEGHNGIPSDNFRLFDIMVEHGLVTANSEGKAIWKAEVIIQNWTPAPFSLLCLPASTIFVSKESWPEDLDGQVLPLIDGAIDAQAKTPEPQLGASKPIKSETSNSTKPAPISNLRSLFLDDTDGDGSGSIAPVSEIAESNTKPDTEVATQDDLPPTEKASFKTWLESGLVNGSLSHNTAKSQVHVLEEGLFLVSPAIFKAYGEDACTDWEKAQRVFQNMKLHRKNQQEENWFEIKIKGKKGVSKVKGWILPLVNLTIPKDTIDKFKPNPLLSLVTPFLGE